MHSFHAKARRYALRGAASCAALAAGVAAGPAMAQTAGAEQNADVVVVTAQFREQNVQDTPLAITAVNNEMMRARSQTNVAEISNQAPSVTLKPQSSAYGNSMSASIRGVGQYDFNPAYEPGVGIYIDDVYYGSLTGAAFDLLDLERVEILRGPQGTLAGRNSIGGAVKLYTREPEGEEGGFIEGTYGSRDRLGFRASYDFTLADNLFARIAGVTKQQDGYVDRLDYGCLNPSSPIPPLVSTQEDCLLGTEGGIAYSAVRGQVRWVPNSRLEVKLSGDYIHDDSESSPTVLRAADNSDPKIMPYGVPYDDRFVPPDGSYYNYANYFHPEDTLPSGYAPAWFVDANARYEGWGSSAHVEYDLADRLSLVSITGYREYESEFGNDNDSSPAPISLGLSILDFWSFSQELRLNGAFGPDDDIEYTLGGYYLDQQTTYESLQGLRYAADGLIFAQNDPVDADTQAVFAHTTWHATDQLSVNAGIRYTEESKTYEYVRRTRDGSVHPFLGGLDGEVGEYNGDSVDYRLAVDYRWTDNFMTYAQFATGFKGGGVNPRPFIATQVQPFGPETVNSYEGGFKSDFWGGRMRLNGSVFFSDYADIQLTVSSCPQFSPAPGFPCALPQNTGDADIKGVELETSIEPVDGLLIDGALSYLDFEYQSINPAAGGPTNPGGVQFDDVAPFTPEWKWSIGAQYEIALGEWGSITPRVDASYQDTIYTNAGNSTYAEIEDYTVLNGRLTWRNDDRDWEVALEVTNLTDEYYYLTAFDQFSNNGLASGQPGRPREFAVTVRKDF